LSQTKDGFCYAEKALGYGTFRGFSQQSACMLTVRKKYGREEADIMKKVRQLLRQEREAWGIPSLLRVVFDGKRSVYASAGAFYLFLSLFPAAAILCALLPYTQIPQAELLRFLSAVLPSVMQELLQRIVEDVYGYSAAAISVSTVVLLWSAGKSFAGLTRGLEYVYRGGQGRSYLRLRLLSSVYTLGLMLVMLLSLATSMLQQSLLSRVNRFWPRLGLLLGYVVRLRYPAAMLMLAVFFALLYRFLPTGKRKLMRQIPGALLASALWMLLSWVFSLVLNRMHSGSVYGSLATVAFAMFWISWCMEIVLFGGAFNVWLESERREGRA